MLNFDFFHKQLPSHPSGKYAHIVMLRETKGYALFQTDGELNRARVSAGVPGVGDETPMTRITIFKRKQTTPERLNGRELLRRHGILADMSEIFEGIPPKKDGDIKNGVQNFNKGRKSLPYACIYNVRACNRCPDCITYGFAIGGGSEKSKVYSDTAFSLTDYAVSHEVFTLNAPYEDGTMSNSEEGMATSLAQQDHVKPQVFFPSVITTRDLTANLFLYVLNNVTRTERYGAITTRGGTVKNHIVAIILSDGEIFSNLLFTQRLYDILKPEGNDPVKLSDAVHATKEVIPALLKEDNVREEQVLMGAELGSFLQTLRETPDNKVLDVIQGAMSECEDYYRKYISEEKTK